MAVRLITSLVVTGAFLMGGCSTGGGKVDGSANHVEAAGNSQNVAIAILKDATGKAIGEAQFTQEKDGIAVSVSALGLPPGLHGTHVHMTGKCDAPDFTTAGGHWNPASHSHGLENPQGAHGGDLPNMDVAADGTGTVSFLIPNASLHDGASPMMDADGAAVVIHADPDDMKSDPAGNAGKRLVCGVVTGD